MSVACRSWCYYSLLALTVGGCSESPNPNGVPVSGRVTLDGKPLASGTIIFEPKGPAGARVKGQLQDGQFNIPKELGPVPGRYAVAIFGGPVDPEAAAKFQGDFVRSSDPMYQKIREIVPDRYNVRTTLEADVQAAGDNAFNFDLRSDPHKR